MSAQITFTREELLQLRAALRIAREDGSIYGVGGPGDDPELDGILDGIAAKLNVAIDGEGRQ